MKESDIQKEILEWLFWNGVFAWRQPNQAMRHHGGTVKGKAPMPGLPDILGVMPWGQALFIEVKTPDGTVSLQQKQFIDQAIEFKALAFVARSLDDVIAKINPFLEKAKGL